MIEIDFRLGLGPGQAKLVIDGRQLDDVQSFRLEKSVNEPTRLHLVLVPEIVVVRGPLEEVTTKRALVQEGALGQRFRSVGQVAFEAFTDGQDYRLEQRPQWSERSPEEQANWEAAALAVLSP